MGFHKRYINNDQIIDMYRSKGNQAVIDWYTNGVDAIITETGLSSDVLDLLNRKINNVDKWNMVSELISNESIKKGFDKKLKDNRNYE